MATIRRDSTDPIEHRACRPPVPDIVRRWSTREVPQTDRLDYFASALSEALIPLAVDNADPRTFHADVSFASLGKIEICKAIGAPHRTFRGSAELGRTDKHTFNLLMSLTGSWTAQHRGVLNLMASDIVLHDSQYPVDTDTRESFVGINVVLTESWLRQWLPNPGVLVARRIPGRSLWGRALSSYLAELSPEFALVPPLPLSVLADQIGGLLALAAAGLQGATPAYTPTVRSIHERVQDIIVQRCTESQLTAADVAGSAGISVRTLHRAFAAAQETFGAKLMAARVRVAVRMLGSPLFQRVTIAEIGRRAGFLSASHFARTIHKRTGRTPLQVRRLES